MKCWFFASHWWSLQVTFVRFVPPSSWWSLSSLKLLIAIANICLINRLIGHHTGSIKSIDWLKYISVLIYPINRFKAWQTQSGFHCSMSARPTEAQIVHLHSLRGLSHHPSLWSMTWYRNPWWRLGYPLILGYLHVFIMYPILIIQYGFVCKYGNPRNWFIILWWWKPFWHDIPRQSHPWFTSGRICLLMDIAL